MLEFAGEVNDAESSGEIGQLLGVLSALVRFWIRKA